MTKIAPIRGNRIALRITAKPAPPTPPASTPYQKHPPHGTGDLQARIQARDVTFALIQAWRVNIADAKLIRTIQQPTVACLGHWKRRGYLKLASGPGAKGALVWEIAQSRLTITSYDVGKS